jgi:2-amino-4-hydroxy-6-hydroxymethyldihydropteridine diphosphokinase
MNIWDDAIAVALGSNLSGGLDSSVVVLRRALDAFPDFGFQVKVQSTFWRSSAWPDPADPAFVNALAFVETLHSPEAALEALHALEARFGRVRATPNAPPNAPRTLDLDLIAYGRRVQALGAPVLPHPRAEERRFVMGPLAEIAPDWRHPVSGETAEVLAARASVGRDARPLGPAA